MSININQKDVKQLYNHLKASAKKRKIPFDISIAEFYEITIPISCPVLGIPLVFNLGSAQDNSVSFDRKDSTRGYSYDNIIVVSNRVNKLKSDASLEELKKISDYYTNLSKEEWESNYQNVRNEITEYFLLNDDWDGYGGKAPKKETLYQSILMLKIFKENDIKPPKIMLSGSGEVSFYWKEPNRYVELTVEVNDLFSMWYEDQNEIFDFDNQDLPIIFSDLNEKIQLTLKKL